MLPPDDVVDRREVRAAGDVGHEPVELPANLDLSVPKVLDFGGGAIEIHATKQQHAVIGQLRTGAVASATGHRVHGRGHSCQGHEEHESDQDALHERRLQLNRVSRLAGATPIGRSYRARSARVTSPPTVSPCPYAISPNLLGR